MSTPSTPQSPPFRIYSRKKIDISYLSLLSALLDCLLHLLLHPFLPSSPSLSSFSSTYHPTHYLQTLTSRSALSSLLSSLSLPRGSEILISAITIPSIPLLIRAHGLVPVALDVRPDTTISPHALAQAITPNTKAVILAQLFGARWDISALVAVARERGVLVIEDCAQAFDGREGLGRDTGADVVLFSFGPIKTCSALGGGVVYVPRDEGLVAGMRRVQGKWEVQATAGFAGRVGRYAVFKAVAGSGWVYGGLVWGLRGLGIDSGAFITDLGRNVGPGGDLLGQIRKRPCAALTSRYWLCPIRVGNPALVVEKLLGIGIDAADGGTSLVAVPGDGVVEATKMMSEVVYLPIDHAYSTEELVSIAHVFRKYGRAG